MGLAVGAVAIFPCAAGLCSFTRLGDSGNSGFGNTTDGGGRNRANPPPFFERRSPKKYIANFFAIIII